VRIKLDENFSPRIARLFHDAGHQADTVVDEGLGGAADAAIFEACIQESRCLVTLDLDFADVVRFPPHRSAGIAVVRLQTQASIELLDRLIGHLLVMLNVESIAGRLWIIELGRIRMHGDTSG